MDNIVFKNTKEINTADVRIPSSPLMMFKVHVTGKHSNSKTKYRVLLGFNSKYLSKCN